MSETYMCVILAWVQSSIFSIANIKKKRRKRYHIKGIGCPLLTCADPESFFRGGPNFDYVFFFFFFFFFFGGGGGVGGAERIQIPI